MFCWASLLPWQLLKNDLGINDESHNSQTMLDNSSSSNLLTYMYKGRDTNHNISKSVLAKIRIGLLGIHNYVIVQK